MVQDIYRQAERVEGYAPNLIQEQRRVCWITTRGCLAVSNGVLPVRDEVRLDWQSPEALRGRTQRCVPKPRARLPPGKVAQVMRRRRCAILTAVGIISH